MSTTQDRTVSQVSEEVDILLKRLSEDVSLPSRLKTATDDVYHLYHTSLRTDILNILLPILHRLRKRISTGDVNYFASKGFITGVTSAVEQRCREVVAEGKMRASAMDSIGPNMMPILEAIQCKAQDYINGDGEMFEFIMERMTEILKNFEAC